MAKEKLPDPLETINQHQINREALTLQRRLKLTFNQLLALSTTDVAAVGGATFLLHDPILGLQWTGFMLGFMIRPAFRHLRAFASSFRHPYRPLPEEADAALARLKRIGIGPKSVRVAFDNRTGLSEEFGVYHMARRARATKLWLAEKGRLKEYREGVWLSTIGVPKWSKPTRAELTEVSTWAQKKQQKLNAFAQEVAGSNHLAVTAGDEMLKETVRVYPQPLRNKCDLWDQRSFPMIDVMRALAATQDQLREVGFRQGLEQRVNPNGYQGIHTERGRQRITDFFGKPVSFYLGGEVIHTTVTRYGVQEPEVFVDHDFFCVWDVVETTPIRLKKIGLELATA